MNDCFETFVSPEVLPVEIPKSRAADGVVVAAVAIVLLDGDSVVRSGWYGRSLLDQMQRHPGTRLVAPHHGGDAAHGPDPGGLVGSLVRFVLDLNLAAQGFDANVRHLLGVADVQILKTVTANERTVLNLSLRNISFALPMGADELQHGIGADVLDDERGQG